MKCTSCGRREDVCMCYSSNDPLETLRRQSLSQGSMPVGATVSQSNFGPLLGDLTGPYVKKWADELREIAKKSCDSSPPEPKSLYIYMLERCKLIAKEGLISTVFWGNCLIVWTKEEIEMAADLLREDNFKVEVSPLSDNLRIHISWA